MDIFEMAKQAGLNRVSMLAIAQSENIYHYLNWIPSESGPMITHYGKIDKKLDDHEKYKKHYHEVLTEIISTIHNEEPICTYSLDSNDLIFSTLYTDENSPELLRWYQRQVMVETMDYYHYPMYNGSGKLLSIGIPQIIRKSFQDNIYMLKMRLNGIGTGIFSAESGARHWFHAEKLNNYLVWKIGKKKRDEILYINNNKLESYFSIVRSSNKVNINWQFGNRDTVDMICQYIKHLGNNNSHHVAPANKIFIYTCNGKIQDIKDIQKKDIENIILLNPLSVLKMTDEKKINLFTTLALAETGNAFEKIDV